MEKDKPRRFSENEKGCSFRRSRCCHLSLLSRSPGRNTVNLFSNSCTVRSSSWESSTSRSLALFCTRASESFHVAYCNASRRHRWTMETRTCAPRIQGTTVGLIHTQLRRRNTAAVTGDATQKSPEAVDAFRLRAHFSQRRYSPKAGVAHRLQNTTAGKKREAEP